MKYLCISFLLSISCAFSLTVSDDFNTGSTNPSLWSATSNAIVRGAGEPGFNGSHSLWFDGAGERSATTQPFNTAFGASLSFRFRVGNSYLSGGGPRPIWEQADPPEYVVIEFSHHGGPWCTLRSYAGWNAYAYGNWNLYTIDLPAVALSPSARYRFRQTQHSGPTWDHWAIDDVSLAVEDPVGTSWSQSLPGGLIPNLIRLAPTGGLQALFTATEPFTLGSFSGTAGKYLAASAADGSWTALTALNADGAVIRDMAIDASGNILLSGAYTGSPLGLTSASHTCGFVVKFNASHQLQWSRTGWNLTTHGADFTGLAVDGSGNVTVAGTYHYFMRFGPNGNIGEPELSSSTPANPSGELNATVLARFDASGNYQWSRRIGDSEYKDPDKVHGHHQDSSGNLYLFGFYNSQESLGNVLTVSPLSPLDGPDTGSQQLGYIVKFDSSGNPQWATNLGWCSDLRDVTSSGGILYAAGTYGGGAVEFSPQGVVVPEYGDPDSAADDIFMLRLDPASGGVSWVKTAGPYCATIYGNEVIRTSPSGNAYWLHQFNQDHSLETTSITGTPIFDRVLSAWQPDGTMLWHKRAKMGSVSMATDSIGQTYVAGLSAGLAVFESSATTETSFIHKFNNIFEATKPAAVDLIRSTIPSNWPGDTDLGELFAIDADGAGTYTYALVSGDGDEHNAVFQINGSGHLLLASDARLVEGDALTCRVRVTDENGDFAETAIDFTVIAPDFGQWATPILGGSATVTTVAATADGGIVAGGRYYDVITAGAFTDTTLGSQDWFAAKFDSEGTAEWLVTGGNTGYDQLRAIDCGSDGLVHLACEVSTGAGNFTIKRNGGIIHQSSATLANGGGRDLCIVSLTPTGGFRWVSRMGGTYNDYPYGIAYDPATGRCAVTGQFTGNLHTEHYLARLFQYGNSGTFSGSLITANGGNSSTNGEVFVISYDANGDREWVKCGGSNRTSSPLDYGNDVAFDTTGNVVVIGNFAGSATFGSTTLIGGGSNPYYNHNAFLWKLDPTGNHVWAKSGGTLAHDDEGLRVGIDDSGNIQAAYRIFGYSGDTAVFSPLNITPTGAGDYDVLVIRYNSSGTPQDYHQFGDHPSAGFTSSQSLIGFRVYPSGEMMIGAPCTGIDGNYINPTGYHHYYDSSNTLQWSGTVWGPSVFDYSDDLIPLASGTAYENQEIGGVILPAGPYVAQLEGPTPVREAPTGITLTPPVAAAPAIVPYSSLSSGPTLSVLENQPAGTVVATIYGDDTDSTDFVYQLIGGLGSDGNPAFTISGDQLVTTGPLNYEEIPIYSIRLRVIDESGLAYEESFVIDVEDVYDTITPTFTFSDLEYTEDGLPHGATVTVDPYGLPFTVTYNGWFMEPSAAGAYIVTASPDHPEYAGDDSAALWIRDAFMQWIAGKINPGVAMDPWQETTGWGRLADYDHDGTNNLLEYYFNSDPALNDPQKNRILIGQATPGGFTSTWTRRKNGPAADLQWSSDLQTWHASGENGGTINLSVLEDLGDEERVQATVTTGSPKAFLRIRVP